MGALYGRLEVRNDTGSFYMKHDYQKNGCHWFLKFLPNNLKIETINSRDECEFGYAVIADGNFKRRSAKMPKSFVDIEGNKISFKETPPEKYNK
ncbi:MAG: hypothetical protein IPP96_06535 [Chitinophagaceae bacterium]|nr:hypothetical protein [Chitinophagaceae bacterium]